MHFLPLIVFLRFQDLQSLKLWWLTPKYILKLVAWAFGVTKKTGRTFCWAKNSQWFLHLYTLKLIFAFCSAHHCAKSHNCTFKCSKLFAKKALSFKGTWKKSNWEQSFIELKILRNFLLFYEKKVLACNSFLQYGSFIATYYNLMLDFNTLLFYIFFVPLYSGFYAKDFEPS